MTIFIEIFVINLYNLNNQREKQQSALKNGVYLPVAYKTYVTTLKNLRHPWNPREKTTISLKK